MSSVSKSNTENKQTTYTVSDDTLDYLDTQVDEFNDTDNLGKKITIHRKLKEITKILIDEIDNMVEMIDDIDETSLNSEFYETKEDDNDDINDDIIKLEDIIDNMEEEESIQVKISHYKRIAHVVKKCRAKCSIDKMVVLNINE